MEMRRNLIAGLTVLSLTLLPAFQAHGQAYKSSLGWSGGVVSTTSLNDGATESGAALSLEPDLTWTAGVHYDRWFGGHIGFRGEGGISRYLLPWTQGDRVIYTYSGDLSLLLRLAAPSPGRNLLPFISGGVGFSRWGLGSGDPTTFSPAGVSYDGEESFDLLVPFSVGLDYITPWRWGEGPLVIRIEGRDHLQLTSPFDPLNPDQDDFGMIHNYGVVIGLHTGLGIL
jgi:hypothetical protein